MKKCAFISLFLLLNFNSFSQKCDCTFNFKWLKDTFEKNDAGFEYILKKKGQLAYNYLNQDISNRAQATNDFTTCKSLMEEWLRFFRKYHLSISLSDSLNKLENIKYVDDLNKSIANISKSTFDSHEKFIIDDDKWNLYLKNLDITSVEGVWSSPPYTIGIIKDENIYKGFVISAPGTPFRKGDLKLKLTKTNLGYTGMTYTKDFKPVNGTQARYNYIGPNNLYVGTLSLKRITPTYQDPIELADYKNSIYSDKPYLVKLSDETVYFLIPSFDISQKKVIDSVILNNENILSSAKNLIIDIRRNRGGSDYSYENLLPFIHTSPIRSVGVEYKSTPLNNEAMLMIANDTLFNRQTREWYKKSYDNLQKNIGEYILLTNKPVTIDAINIKSKAPLHIAILTDNSTGSSAEQFVLDAKQSSKVKIYGKPTLGSLDISNMNSTKSPSGEFILRYGTSKSLRIPEYQIDDIGLMPDVYLDSTIPDYLWVEFAKSKLEKL